MAAEHILFHLVQHVEAQHPGLIDRIEQSLDHLGDPGKDGTADDEAVREIARRFLASARQG
jgi:plasmid stabilization system protein ParE